MQMVFQTLFIGALLVAASSAVTFSHDSPHASPTFQDGVDEFTVVNENIDGQTIDGPDGGIVHGDMVMTTSGNAALFGTDTNSKRGAIKTSFGQIWTTKVVPYVVSDSLVRAFQGLGSNPIKDAMEEIQSQTCITFVPKTDEADYLWFVNEIGCWSFVGKLQSGGAQRISLQSGCWNKRICVHEIMHALGFLHEQSRPDRDDYITVKYDNIPEAKKDQFKKYSSETIDSLGEEYDYVSVMHYQGKDYAIDSSKNTIERKDDPSLPVGQSSPNGGLTKSDAEQLRLLYQCGDSPTTNSTTPAPEATTGAPETTTGAPEATTGAPEATTGAPETTTGAAETTTPAAETTTTAPGVTTTQATVATTQAPDTTTQATETTTTTSVTATTSTLTAGPTTTTVTTTKRPKRCGFRCVLRRILERLLRRRRVQRRRRTWNRRRRFISRRRRRRRRRRRSWGRRRRSAGWELGWGKKKDETHHNVQDTVLDSKDVDLEEKGNEKSVRDSRVAKEDATDGKGKEITNLDNIFSQLDDDDDGTGKSVRDETKEVASNSLTDDEEKLLKRIEAKFEKRDVEKFHDADEEEDPKDVYDDDEDTKDPYAGEETKDVDEENVDEEDETNDNEE